MARMFLISICFFCAFSIFGCKQFSSPQENSAKVKWSYPNSSDFLDSVQPLIESGKTYIASDTSVACVDLITGNTYWKVRFGNTGSFATRKIMNSETSIFLNHMNLVKSIEKRTGKFLWETTIPGFSGVDLSTMSINQTHLFVGGSGEVVRISRTNGAVDLRIRLDSLKPSSVTQSSHFPLVSTIDNMVYVPTGYYCPQSGATEGNMLCYNAQTGDYVWGFHLAVRKVWLPALNDSIATDVASYACAIKDSLIVLDSGHYLIALNRFTGIKIWESFISDGGFDMPPAIEGENIYVGSNNTHVYSFNLRSGQIQWRTKTSGSITTIFTIQGDRVYLCNGGGGDIWILEAATGSVIWRGYPPEFQTYYNAIFESPVAVGDGHMVDVGSKRVYCLTIP